jgi:hypothetical protein
MPIRAQCSNCSRVYNLPDDNAGKRLRCKQCAVVFTVPAAPASAPTVSASGAKQKICVGCGTDVSGQPRTKDQLGRYYCRPCYAEYARQHQGAVAQPATVGAPHSAGGGSGDDDMIDLSTLEETEPAPLDDLPPPPPIPDVYDPQNFDQQAYDQQLYQQQPVQADEPIYDPTGEMVTPKKKKKKKKKQVEVAAPTGFMSKLAIVPLEGWIVAVCLLFVAFGFISTQAAFISAVSLFIVGAGLILWSDIACLMLAYAEDSMTGKLYWIFPPYRFYFCLTRWSQVWRHLAREGLGFLIVIGGFGMLIRGGVSAFEDMEYDEEMAAVNLSTDPRFEIYVDDASESEASEGVDQRIADVILESFKRRNVQPSEGKYFVYVTIEPGMSKQKLKLRANGKEVPFPAPKLTAEFSVVDKDEAIIFEKSSDIEPDKSLLDVEADQEDNNSSKLIKKLWADVIPAIKAMADEVPASNAPADADKPADAINADAARAPPASEEK